MNGKKAKVEITRKEKIKKENNCRKKKEILLRKVKE